MYLFASWEPGLFGKGAASRDAGVKPACKYSRRPLTDMPGFQDSIGIFIFYSALKNKTMFGQAFAHATLIKLSDMC